VWWLLLLIPVAWWLLQTVTGAALPAHTTGRLYLRQLSKKAGVLHLVPEECIRELTTDACKIAEMVAFGRGSMEMKTELVKAIQGTAAVILEWVQPTGLPLRETDLVPTVLAKYGVPRGSRRQ